MVRLERMIMQNFKSFAGRIVIPFPAGFTAICGANGSGKCLDYDSTVLLADGKEVKIGELVEHKISESKNVKNLDDGLYVGNVDGLDILTMEKDLKLKSRKIRSFIKRKSPKKMLKIRTRSGREIISTKYHPFFSINDNGLFSLKAEQIRKGVRIAVPRNLPMASNIDNKLDVSMLEDLYVPYSDEIKSSLRSVIAKSGLTQKEFAEEVGVSHYAIKGLMDGQSIRLGNLTKMMPNFKASVTKSKNAGKAFNMPSVLTPELARFAGYIISEGQSTRSNQIWFVNEDENDIEDFVTVTKSEFGAKANVFDYKEGCRDVIVFSKPIQLFIEKIMDIKIGSKSAEKVVPEVIRHANREIICNFLGALYDGDGYLNFKERGKKVQIYTEYCTASKQLAYDVQSLLLKLGVLSHIKKKMKYAANTKNKTKRPYYSVITYGREAVGFLKHVKLKNKRKSSIAKKILEYRCAANPNLDTIPNLNKLIRLVIKESKINIKKSTTLCPKLRAYYQGRCDFSREGLNEVLDFIESKGKINSTISTATEQLRMVANSAIFWDEIVEVKEITPKGKWVYDLEVEETHNYVANNFFVHNSNTVDALTFVLGVQSARAIRAQKLQNLIFNGARSKKPADFCEVTLELDNSDGKVPGYGKELNVTRRITRSGISVYKINGHTVIKSKALDLLSQTGMSPEGHNIIMQGDIMRIIEMSAKERRGIIDDISGIAEFNQKKEEALRKLERTESRVNEALAVVGEKQRRVEQLKTEKENAEKYQRLNAELRQALASSINAQLKASTEELGQFKTETHDWQGKVKELDKEIAAIDKELIAHEADVKSKNDALIAKGGAETRRAIDRTESDILRKRDRSEFIKSQIDQFKAFSKIEHTDLSKLLPFETRSFASVVSIPTEYSTAISVAVGGHARDLIVKNDAEGVRCIRWLKEQRAGRARFLPLNKLFIRARRELRGVKDKGFLGWALDLIVYEQQWYPAVSYVLGHTVLASDIEAAARIAQPGIKIVTLDGDVIEPSGAMSGGFREHRHETPTIDLDALTTAREALLKDVANLAKELEDLKKADSKEHEQLKDLYAARDAAERSVVEIRAKRSSFVEQKFALQNRSNRIEIDKAKVESRVQELTGRVKEFKDVEKLIDLPSEELSEIIRSRTTSMRELGPINMRAIEDYQTISTEFIEMKSKLDKLLEEKASILKTIEEVEKHRHEKFMGTLTTIAANFSTIFKDLTGGIGQVRLEDPVNIDSGLIIEASPANKNVIDLDVMSGGEKTVTSLAFLFAIMQHYASPLYVMDEVDAALDKPNTRKVAALLHKYSKSVQFLVITHNDITSSAADKVFGVAMEDGASKIFGIELPKK